MTVQFAIDYIPRRMKFLGVGSNYYTDVAHLVLQPNETREINAHNQFYILVHEATDVSISSDNGVYDLSDPNINQVIYEHRGNITITNYSQGLAHVQFIQVILINQ